MTTRFKGFQVTLSADTRDDDAQRIIDAIMMVRGVADVRPIESDIGDTIIENRIRRELRTQLYEFADSLK